MGRSVVTLGVFDGLHRGHQRVLGHARRLGHESGRPVVLTTFDPNPATIAGRPRDTTPIATLEHRAELARHHGADAVLVLPFTAELARTRGLRRRGPGPHVARHRRRDRRPLPLRSPRSRRRHTAAEPRAAAAHRVHGTVTGEILAPTTELLPQPGKYRAATVHGERIVRLENGLLHTDLPAGPAGLELLEAL